MSLTTFDLANGGPGSLERLIRELHEAFTTVPQRRIAIDGQVIEARNVESPRGRALLIHLVAYTPDDPISVVPAARRVSAAGLQLLDAPPNTEFLDGQFMALVHGDDVVLCREGMGEAGFVSYVLGLAQSNGMDTSTLAFQLMKRADVDKLEMVRREGVASISMNTVAHEASVAHIERRSIRERIGGGALDELKAILGIGDELPADAENLKVEVLFSFDKRGGTRLDQQHLTSLAELLVNDEDQGFSIKTLSGRTLRADDIVLSKPVTLTAHGKSVRHTDVWEQLRIFYAELNQVREQ
jgi:hypothetical protein